MVEIKILHANDSLPSDVGDYLQVVRRVSSGDRGITETALAFQKKGDPPGAGFEIDKRRRGLSLEEALAWARSEAERRNIGQIYVVDHTAR